MFTMKFWETMKLGCGEDEQGSHCLKHCLKLLSFSLGILEMLVDIFWSFRLCFFQGNGRQGILRKINPGHIRAPRSLKDLPKNIVGVTETTNLRKWLYSSQSTVLDISLDPYSLVVQTDSYFVPCEEVFLSSRSLVRQIKQYTYDCIEWWMICAFKEMLSAH